MTNNPTIDGVLVPRELLELCWLTLVDNSSYAEEVRDLLDAPAAERKPKGAILRFREYVGKGQGGRDLWRDWTEWSTGTVEYAKSKLDHTKDLTHIQFEVEWLYSDTPEVAALQSTIAHLEARAAELESGRGEPVAWMCFDGEGNYDFTDDPETAEAWSKSNGEQYADWLTPLFTAPPASVAGVTDERAAFDAWAVKHGRVVGYSGWRNDFEVWKARACLDATAALNEKSKQ